MDDRELANAAAVHFGGRARAEHWLSCSTCYVDDDGKPQPCPRAPRAAAASTRLRCSGGSEVARGQLP